MRPDFARRNADRGLLNFRMIVTWTAVVIVLAAAFATLTVERKEVSILVDGKHLTVSTFGNTVGDVLAEQDIELRPSDKVVPTTDFALNSGMEITITRSFPVIIVTSGVQLEVWTTAKTVGEAISDASIALSELDYTVPEATAQVVEGMEIKVVRVERRFVSEHVKTDYERFKRPNDTMDRGTERVVRKGQPGIQKLVYEVTYEDGTEVSRRPVSSFILKQKQDELVEYGTLGVLEIDGNVYRYRRSMPVIATAYYAGPESTGKDVGHPLYGITRTGIPVQVGHIAVDPRVIPLLSRVYVEGHDEYGRRSSGVYTATDTGALIKGNRIDIYFKTYREALLFGRRRMTVYLLVD